jgi:predicted tellurium resistance membrane protein TerC
MSENAIVKFCSGLFAVSPDYDGDKFFTLVEGVKTATPLLLCLCVIEVSDVVFAVDSIPAVFGVTKVFTHLLRLLTLNPES